MQANVQMQAKFSPIWVTGPFNVTNVVYEPRFSMETLHPFLRENELSYTQVWIKYYL